MGGGVIGAATALALAQGTDRRKPLQTILLESWQPGHERGSSHGDGRIVRYTYAEPEYLHMARHATQAWHLVSQRAAVELLLPTGSWECGPANSAALAEIARGLESMDLPYERLDAEESRRRFPQLTLPKTSQALYQADGSVIRADAALQALWDLAGNAGADLRTEHRVSAIECQGDHLRIVGPGWEIRAARVVLAAGGWSGPLLAELGCQLPLEVRRETTLYFPPQPGAFDHRAGALPTIIDYHRDPPFYALPQLRIPAVKTGWHHSGPIADPEVPTRAEGAEAVRKWVANRLPQLQSEPERATTCLYTNTPDYHFVLDHLPADSRIVVAAGFSGHGFKFAPSIGAAAADLIADLEPEVDISLFAIDRFHRSKPIVRRFLA